MLQSLGSDSSSLSTKVHATAHPCAWYVARQCGYVACLPGIFTPAMLMQQGVGIATYTSLHLPVKLGHVAYGRYLMSNH